MIETWRRHYNTILMQTSLRNQPPAPEVLQWPTSQLQTAELAIQRLAQNAILN